MLPLQICGEPPREAARRVRAALDKVGLLGHEKAMPVDALGRRAAAALHRARDRAPAGDPARRRADRQSRRAAAAEVMEIFRAFNQVGVTVVIATHDAALVDRFGTRAVRLDHGRVQPVSTPCSNPMRLAR